MCRGATLHPRDHLRALGRGLQYRGTSLIRNTPFLGPYSRTTYVGAYGGPRGGAVSYERGTPVRSQWCECKDNDQEASAACRCRGRSESQNETTTLFDMYHEATKRACQHASYADRDQALALASFSGGELRRLRAGPSTLALAPSASCRYLAHEPMTPAPSAPAVPCRALRRR